MIVAYTDGACRLGNPGLCSVAYVIYDKDGVKGIYGRVLLGRNTNNVAEYTALIDLLKWAEANGVRNIMINCDSELVVNQVNQKYAINKPELKKFANLAYALLVRGAHVLVHVKGHDGDIGNEAADQYCNKLLDDYMATEEFRKEWTINDSNVVSNAEELPIESAKDMFSLPEARS